MGLGVGVVTNIYTDLRLPTYLVPICALHPLPCQKEGTMDGFAHE